MNFNKKILIICISIHNGNTLKVAKIISEQLNAEIKKPSEVQTNDINDYDLICFGSGIYSDKHHTSIFDFIEKLPEQNNKKAIIFSTSGVPIKNFGQDYFYKYTKKCNKFLEDKLVSKGFSVLGDFSCPGFNTNSFLKFFGGLNKGRPDVNDFEKAKEFIENLMSTYYKK